MQALNPLLRAFFSSKFLAQCSPASNYIILAPTSEFLFTHTDRETGAVYRDLASSEEFLGSHVVRIPAGGLQVAAGKEPVNLRDGKNKAKQLSTANGRTIVVKDGQVYSNKGFKNLHQAQLLYDAIYYPDLPETAQWLVYYISRPLLGSPEAMVTPLLMISPSSTSKGSKAKEKEPNVAMLPKQQPIKTFNDILNQYPMIARQLQPGLEKLFNQFQVDVEKAKGSSGNGSLSGASTAVEEYADSNDTVSPDASANSNEGSIPIHNTLEPSQSHMRQALETLVLAAVDLFQQVDKQQLSLLGTSTDLSGAAVERMIERFVTEHMHNKYIFPRLRESLEFEDAELESYIKQMTDIDISQIGIPIEDGHQGKRELNLRLAKGVTSFKRMDIAESQQEMIEILLDTEKNISSIAGDDPRTVADTRGREKHISTTVAMDADMLVALLLVVLIRSPVRHLHARLAYMRDFSFVSDVENGEIGYALSTFEAVLSHLSNNSGGLRRASRANRALWHAVKKGNINGVRRMLDLENPDFEDLPSLSAISEQLVDLQDSETKVNAWNHWAHMNGNMDTNSNLGGSNLAHVFPFARRHSEAAIEPKPKMKKRVSMEAASISSSSAQSFRSRASTLQSGMSLSAETSISQVAHTQDLAGNSVLLQAITHMHLDVLRYLLSRDDLFSLAWVLGDCNDENTTVLSAAVQQGDRQIIECILDFILDRTEDDYILRNYMRRKDVKGRSVAHYLFNAHHLIPSLGPILAWHDRDNNGCTPLFALCRSYDHEEYNRMVRDAIVAASKQQADGDLLHLDEHTDSRSNTLLHITPDSRIIQGLLKNCDSNPNASNDKRFTPLMTASKFARLESIQALMGDPRTDLQARDLRGLTAVELAKDDEVRTRIDELVLLAEPPDEIGRRTTIVRSFFVDDGSIRVVIKSGSPIPNHNIRIITSRRSVKDFENLIKWLSTEHPASWIPVVHQFRTPFQIPSKPSRAVLRDTQLNLDGWLKSMLSHPTFVTHEMLWEFLLVPDIDPAMLAERTQMKASLRVEKLREEYEPLFSEIPEVEQFTTYAREQVRSVNKAAKTLFRRVCNLRNAASDLADAQNLITIHLSTLQFLPPIHLGAFARSVTLLHESESSPLTHAHHTFNALISTSSAVQTALGRPTSLIGSINASHEALAKHNASLLRTAPGASSRWPTVLVGGLLDDTRARLQQEAKEKADKAEGEMEMLGRELRYTQQTVVEELAGWQKGHVDSLKQGLRNWVEKVVVVERERLAGLKRCLRDIERAKRAESA